MSLLREKFSEVSRSLVPVVTLVLLLALTLVEVETDILVRFIAGSALLLVGLSIFLLGVDLAMHPIGDHMATEMATSKTAFKVAGLSFLLGFLVTVAEPDLLILGNQVEAASGRSLSAMMMVYMVSIGVGVMIAFGTFRLLQSHRYPVFMAITYGVIFVLAILVSEEFLAVSFDASGATTGALTTPFVLALTAGLSRIKGGKTAEEDSFGMVGVMSAGPILAVMLMSILTGQEHIQGEAERFLPASGILGPILHELPKVFLESLIALLPLSALFFIMNLAKFKVQRRELGRIIKGLLYTLLGLGIFLTGVYSGFMDMGQIIGRGIAEHHSWFLPILGFGMGMIVVLVEPAVHILGEQIQDATGGRIPVKLIRITLSIGVGLAMAGSMLRIMIPEVKLWFFLLPGFAAAVLLSFISDPVFVGIAYDAGGVASGPMTATFVLAFAQGAAAMTPGANVLVDGFGVIAMVAMTPVLAIMILGAVFQRKILKGNKEEHAMLEESAVPTQTGEALGYDCVMAVLNRGLSQEALDIARDAGAGGTTILHGRGSGGHDMKFLSFEMLKEKEIVVWLIDDRISGTIAKNLHEKLDLGGEGGGKVFLVPALAMGLKAPGKAAEMLRPEPAEGSVPPGENSAPA
ncbi:MAG: DUF1538 domain-containing protein [Eubacteriales bacterium]|nr:DUF1538 domain-containing protein [Eubacteriales bacterium]